MVYYSKQARYDLVMVLKGLLVWKKHPLEFEHAISYVNDIEEVCESLDQPGFHFDTKYRIH